MTFYLAVVVQCALAHRGQGIPFQVQWLALLNPAHAILDKQSDQYLLLGIPRILFLNPADHLEHTCNRIQSTKIAIATKAASLTNVHNSA